MQAHYRQETRIRPILANRRESPPVSVLLENGAKRSWYGPSCLAIPVRYMRERGKAIRAWLTNWNNSAEPWNRRPAWNVILLQASRWKE
jgi:hypothetical protein